MYCFVYHCLFFSPFSFCYCIVCPSPIFSFWVPLWYLRTIFELVHKTCLFFYINITLSLAEEKIHEHRNTASNSVSYSIAVWVRQLAIFQLYHGENELIFNEMMVRSALYKTNTLSWICIVLAHWNNNPRIDMSPRLGHIILIPSQSVFSLSP